MKFILALLALAAVASGSRYGHHRIIGSNDDLSENIDVENVYVNDRGYNGYDRGYGRGNHRYGFRYANDGYGNHDMFDSGSNDALALALDDDVDGYNGGYGGHRSGYVGGYGGYGDRDNNRNRNRNRNANANANANRDENQNRNRNNVKSKNAVEDSINVSI